MVARPGRRAVVALAALLGFGTCGPDAAPAGAQAPGDAGHEREVLALVDAIAVAVRGQREPADGEPADLLDRLAAHGEAALSTIANAAMATADLPTRDVLIDAIGRIGGARAMPTLERFVHVADQSTRQRALRAIARDAGAAAMQVLQRCVESDDDDIRGDALATIGRLQLAAFLPFLREQRESSASRRLQMLATMLDLGDDRVLGEVLQLGLQDDEHRRAAADALLRHAPLRLALGFAAKHDPDALDPFYDEGLLLPAADEWHREQVRGEPSPWRSTPASVFGEPFAAAKRSAWAQLLAAIAAEPDLRVHAGPPRQDADGPLPPLTFLSGTGHGGDLALHLWRPQGTTAAGILITYGSRNGVRVRRGTVAAADFAGMVAALQVVLDARVTPWWTGPGWNSTFSSQNFCVVIGGTDGAAAAPRRFCGYGGSHEGIVSVPMAAADRWYDDYLSHHATIVDSEPTDEVRSQFAAVFRTEQPAWTDSWWWVRERMVAMASYVGDTSLCEPLRRYLAPAFVNGQHSDHRTAVAAIDALGAFTGKDLRRAADGSERPLSAVAADYEALLAARAHGK